MASLSHSERSTKDNNHNYPSNSEDREEWLELGLGFSTNAQEEHEKDDESNPNTALPFPVSASSASSHDLPALTLKPPGCSSTSTALKLGLSLGIDSEHIKAPVLELDDHHEEDEHDEPGYYDEDHYGDDNDDDDLASRWPCHMNSSSALSLNDWQMPVPNNSHHYISRTRPHSGFWFTLHSYTNRNGEALPQISKAYIRVKDENVTIFMVQKYLVRKLGLSNEAEVEISCMGQRLMHTQTLKQVRDCVWLPSFHNYSLQTNSLNNHLMSLYYARQSAFN